MPILRAITILILLYAGVFAFEIQRESQNEFIFADNVAALTSQPCKNDVFFMPDNASYLGEHNAPGIPYRTYVIALPNSSLPSVDVENFKTEKLSGKPCGATQNSNSLKIGKPYLKDNLWRVKISVPLIYSSGNSWILRKDFKVKINFSGGVSGYSVGKRAISSVENKKAALKFGTKQVASPVAKKSSMDQDIDWMLRIGIGSADLSATADGMYALSFNDYERIARAAGKEVDYGITIDQLRLFGASPDTLPEYITEDEIFPSAVEIPILIKDKNQTGIFDSGDTIIFFGYGTAIWKKSNSASGMDYYFSNSPYSFYQYFYLGAGGKGKRLENRAKNISEEPKDVAWKKYARSEKDLLLRDNYFGAIDEATGKEWFWAWGLRNEVVTINSNEFQPSVRNLPGLQGNSILIGVSFFPRPRYTDEKLSWKERMRGINFNFFYKDQKLQNQNIIDTLFGGTFVFAGANASATNNSYKLEILSSSRNDRFDGLSIAYDYDVTQSIGDEWLFPGTATGAIKIPRLANTELVKIENFIPVEIVDGEKDTISSDFDTRYFLHKKGGYKTPAIMEIVPGRMTGLVSAPLEIPVQTEYLILTSEILQNPAVKLKQFRESGNAPGKFNTSVVLVEEIYRNHGAQASPVAIRDYIRYAKKRCPNLDYVLLAGSGNYDFRRIRAGAKNNLIPTYEAEDVSVEDFFAILEPGEEVRFGTYNLALAVGRLPVSNIIEFENYVQKAKDYDSVAVMDNGIWRNTIIFSADDALQGNDYDQIKHTEQMENTVAHTDSLSRKQGFAINWRKISLMQYESDGNNKKPEAARELLLRLNQGALFSFYYGHGNSVQWADEDLLNTSSLNNISNAGRYPILGSFSCSVARFDDASITSLSEVFVAAKSKGAIASIGSLRESYAFYNESIATKILSNSITPGILLGDVILKSKQSASDSYSAQRYNNEKYVLLGEPVLSMPRPEIALKLDSIPNDTIQALQKLKISGTASVRSGTVRIQVLEGEKQRTLSQNIGTGTPYTTQIKIDGNPIYSEDLQINSEGKFETEFITPRKLSLGDTSAQIRLWSYKPGSAGIGRSLKQGITLSGTSAYADSINDNTAPSIKIYPCVRSKSATPYAENAQIALELPACLEVVVEDSTGIDYREEAGEGISFEVSPITYAWHPWPFLEQASKRAVARMEFGNSYDPGEYVFKVNAQDILGNIAFRSLRVSLNADLKAGLADVFSAPNPMKKHGTVFYFKDLSGERQSNITIKIFDQNGKLVKTINNAISGVTHWDGRDSRGRMLANGLYHYVVQNTVQGKSTFSKKQKLVISR